MEIIIQDTYKLYKEMLKLTEGKRREFSSNKLMQPFDPAFKKMHMPKTPEAIASIALTGHDPDIVEMLEKLEKADSWNNAKRTMEIALERFEGAGI